MRTLWLLGILGVIASSPGISLAKNETQEVNELSTTAEEIHSAKSTVKIEENLAKRLELPEEMSSQVLSSSELYEDLKEPIVIPLEGNSTVPLENEIEMKPKNVVLLMIEADMEESLWRTFREKHSSFSQGFSQGCRVLEAFSDSSVVVENKSECHRHLKSNIGSLLNWAGQKKEMNTGTLFAGNFTIPVFFENSSSPVKVEEVNDKKVLNSRSVSMVENKSSSNLFPQHEGENRCVFPPCKNRDPWNLAKFFSEIQLVWLRELLESLRDGFKRNGRRSKICKDVFNEPLNNVDVVEKTIKDFQTKSNENGYLFVAVVPATELFNISEVLLRQISSNNTLLVISGIYSQHGGQIPIFSRGPRSSWIVNRTKTIVELPTAIKSSLDHSHGLRQRENQQIPTFDLPKKRVARSDDEEEEGQGEEEHSNEEIPQGASSSETSAESTESSNPEEEELEPRSTDYTSGTRNCRESPMELFLGLAATITTMSILHT